MTYMMIHLQPSKLLTAALALTTLTTNTDAKKDPLASPLKPSKPDEYTPIDYNDLISEDVTTTTTTTSSRAAEWGTMATTTTTTTTTTLATLSPTLSPTTLSPTPAPSTSPTPLPTPSPSPRPLLKSDILPLCQPTLSTALLFDNDNSTALNPHEFSSFIESISGDRAASILLSNAADDLYKELRKACVTVFKMPVGCADETSTKDDDDDLTDYIVDQGKFDKLDNEEFVFDGVLLVGFGKGWSAKVKEEKKYEEFFCGKVIRFLVKEGVEMDWSLVDGPAAVVTEEVNEVESVVNGTDVNGTDVNRTEVNSTDVNGTEVNGTVDWTVFAEIVSNETSNLTTTTTAATEAAVTTTSSPAVIEEENNTATASEINAADASLIQSINTAQTTSSEATSVNGMPLGGWIGIGLGGALLVFLLAAVIAKKRRSTTSSSNNNDNPDDGSIWSENEDESNKMMQGAGSPLAAIGMASTVATRLTTGDTEVTLMKRQLWTEREPVV